ncbi:MAG: hypothetical protein ACTHQM_07190 [Thermoanaerobaculia bacterium]
MQSRRARHERRCGAARARVAKIEDLETRFAAQEQIAVAERRAAFGLARGHRVHEVFARDLKIADVIRRVRRQDVPAQHINERAGTEHASRRELVIRDCRRGVDQRQRTLRDEVIGKSAGSSENQDYDESDP